LAEQVPLVIEILAKQHMDHFLETPCSCLPNCPPKLPLPWFGCSLHPHCIA